MRDILWCIEIIILSKYIVLATDKDNIFCSYTYIIVRSLTNLLFVSNINMKNNARKDLLSDTLYYGLQKK